MLGKEGKSPQPGKAGDTSLLTCRVCCFLNTVIYLCIEFKRDNRIMLCMALYPSILEKKPLICSFCSSLF